MPNPNPILLLKTKSTPHDAYADFFTSQNYTPTFIPVLEHDFHTANLQTVQRLFDTGALGGPDIARRQYGGLIFTSQRAVEGVAGVLGSVDRTKAAESSKDMILYTVGPATSRSLSALVDAHLPHATIHGAETGNGENLAHYILDHYNRHHNSQRQQGTEEAGGGTRKLPLLFLVGEQRRDIIPKTLMDETGVLPAEERIGVEELVVYETRVREDFEAVFRGVVQDARGYIEGPVDGTEGEGAVWVVVFSPTGCDAMLRVLGLGNQGQNQGQSQGRGGRNVFIASIGPTTRDHLRSKYGFEPDVCAEKPSHEGVGAGINRFMERRKQDAL